MSVLQVEAIDHHLVGEKESPAFYTIYELVEFSVNIQEKTNGVWAPYKGNDVQVRYIFTSVVEPELFDHLDPDSDMKMKPGFRESKILTKIKDPTLLFWEKSRIYMFRIGRKTLISSGKVVIFVC